MIYVVFKKKDTFIEEFTVEGKDGKRLIEKPIEDVELKFKEEIDYTKEGRKIPYVVATNETYNLWKFFASFVDGKVKILKEPRYMIKKGTHWFKIKSMEII